MAVLDVQASLVKTVLKASTDVPGSKALQDSTAFPDGTVQLDALAWRGLLELMVSMVSTVVKDVKVLPAPMAAQD